MTTTYILSQVFVCLCYSLMSLTYVTKKRNVILYLCIIALFFNGIHYFLLDEWAGVGVAFIAIFRNVIFLIQEKIKALDKYKIDDWVILAVLISITLVVAVLTYKTVFDLFTIVASILYTISVWQKNIKAYKILGAIASFLDIVYLIFVRSIFGIILEIMFFIAIVTTSLIYFKNENKKLIFSKSGNLILENEKDV